MSSNPAHQRVGPEAARWPLRAPDQLDPEQRALYDKIVSGPRAGQAGRIPLVNADGALLGPFELMTIAPKIGEAVQHVGAALRFESGLSAITREAAILLVAVHRGCAFEWIAHVTAAEQAGIDEQQRAALGRGEVPEGLGRAETTGLRTARALLLSGTLDDSEYHEAITVIGSQGLAELVWLCGYYSMLALALAVFRPPHPAD